MRSIDTIISVINKKYQTLTNKQKSIANFMLSHTDDMCFMTLHELSENTGASEVTILNFCKVLGCANYNALKVEFRAYASAERKEEAFADDSYEKLSLPEGAGSGDRNLLWQFANDDKNNIQDFYDNMDPDVYIRAAEMIRSVKNVMVIGRGVSLQLADYLVTRLIINRVPCIKINTELVDDVNNCIRLMNRDTLVIAIAYPDYYFMTMELANHAFSKGIKVLGLTDSPSSQLVPFCSLALFASAKNRFYLNSLAAPVCMVNMLTIAIAMSSNDVAGEDVAKSVPRLYSTKTELTNHDGGF